MDRATSQEHTDNIYELFNVSTEMTLVLMNSDFDTDGTICNYFYSQNSMLKSQRSIQVDNLHGLTTLIHKTDNTTPTSIQASFKHPDTAGNTLFLDLIQYNSNCINFLVNRDNEDKCVAIINDFIHNYVPKKLTKESRELITTPDKQAKIIGSKEVPCHVSIFIQNSRQNPLPSFDQDSVASDLSSPPRTFRSTYANAAANTATNLTMTTTDSTTDSTSLASSSVITNLSTKIDDILCRMETKTNLLTNKQATIDKQMATLNTQVHSIATNLDNLAQQVTDNQTSLALITNTLQSFATHLKIPLKSTQAPTGPEGMQQE